MKFKNQPKEFTTYITDPKTVQLWKDFEEQYGAEYIPTPEESNVLCEHLESTHDDIDLIHVDVMDDCLVIKHKLKGDPYTT